MKELYLNQRCHWLDMDKHRFAFPGGWIISAVLFGVLAGASGATLFRAQDSDVALQKVALSRNL
jgi:hypothetical protein